MSSSNNGQKRLLAPVLDRLLDTSGNLNQPHQVLRQLRESVRRDLEHLFNSRYRCVSPPDNSDYMKGSILNFGIPDLSTINMNSSSSRNDFCRLIEKTIMAHDPRIKSVKVKSEQQINNQDPSVHFRVEAVLHTNPAPELIVFDSTLNPVSQSVDVSEIL